MFQKLFSIVLLCILSIVNSANAAIIQPSEILLSGDYSVGENDPLQVTTEFDGTFSSISSVQVIMFLTDMYSFGESYQFSFFNDFGQTVSRTSHSNDNPFGYRHIGYLTNSNTVENLFYDGSATFEFAMLSGSVNVSSIAININGDFVPDPAPVPLPAAAWLFGAGLFGLIGLTRRKRDQ